MQQEFAKARDCAIPINTNKIAAIAMKLNLGRFQRRGNCSAIERTLSLSTPLPARSQPTCEYIATECVRNGSQPDMTPVKSRCPLYPQKRTSIDAISMSALGHKRTHAPQQTTGSL